MMSVPSTRNRLISVTIALVALALVGVLSGTVFLLSSSSKQTLVLPTNQRHFSCIAFSPDGTKLLTAGWDAPLQVWDLSTGARLLELPLKNAAYKADFAPDGQTFAMGSADTTVTRWNLAGERQNPVGYHHSYVSGLAYSPDGKWLATSGHNERVARLWNARTGERGRDLKGHNKWAGAVAFSSDGQLLATGDWDSIRLWEVGTGKMRGHLASGQPVHFVDFSPDGKTVIGGGAYGSILAWEVTTGKPIQGFSAPRGGVMDARFTPDGRYIIARQEKTILLLEALTGRKRSTLAGESWQDKIPSWLVQLVPALKPPTPPDLFGMALSRDGKRLAYSTEKEIRVISCFFGSTSGRWRRNR